MKDPVETEAPQTEPAQLPYLETFARAAELGSFTAAARALGLTQPAVSQRVQQLEKRLGKSLFQRLGGKALLTEAGQRLYEYSQRIFAIHREACQDIGGHEAPVAGELLLAASSVPGDHFLPSLLSEFGQKHPHIRVRASITDSTEVMARVESGEAHLGLVGRKGESSHLQFRHFATDQMVLVVPPAHVWAHRKKITLKDLAEAPIILREPGSGLRHFFEKALENTGRALGEMRVTLELGSNEAIKEAVQRGVGVALLSSLAVQKELRSGELHAVAVTDLPCERELFIVQDKRRVLPFPARLFLLFVENEGAAKS